MGGNEIVAATARIPGPAPEEEHMAEITLEAFRDFAASKPAKERYDYYNIMNCACSQFIASAGRPKQDVLEAAERIAMVRPWTFGALASRLTARLGA